MKKFIKHYENPNEERLNYKLINKEYDRDLVEHIIDCCKSLEVLENITFLGYEYITNEANINTSEYIDARSRNRSKKNTQKYMYLKDSRYAELKLKFKLDCKDESEIIVKKILVPIPDEKGYYTIKGTQYFLMYQIVDNSTYTTKKALTLKSMIPVSMKLKQMRYKCTDDVEYGAQTYTINIFRKDVDIMLFYLAKMGITKTLRYFSVDRIMRYTESIEDNETNIYFSINSKMYLEINRAWFDKYNYVKTITFMLLNVSNNRLSFSNLYDKIYWIEVIGSIGTSTKTARYEKGMSTLTFIDRIVDKTTQKVLKVNDIHKKNIYAVLRWMITHFNELRKKDNLDLNNKRLRCNEYIAVLLTMAFSERINRIIALGKKATLKNIKEIFKFPGDLLLQQLHRSGLLRYDDKVNDMDFFGKLKVTFKGPNSLGGKDENNIAVKYRGIDPSYIGKLDINVCGTSDPGTSAILTPFCKTSGLYFDDNNEPESFKYNFDKEINETMNEKSDIGLDYSNAKNYYDGIESIHDVNSTFRVYQRDNIENVYYIHIDLGDDEIY